MKHETEAKSLREALDGLRQQIESQIQRATPPTPERDFGPALPGMPGHWCDVLFVEGADASEFVASAYRRIFRREPDLGGYEHYVKTLQEGRATKGQIIEELLASDEARAKRVRAVGLDWVLSEVPKIVAEARAEARGMLICEAAPLEIADDETFVRDLYRGLLKREPNLESVNTWAGLLRSGALTRREVVVCLSKTDEAREAHVSAKGRRVMEDRIGATIDTSASMQRQIDACLFAIAKLDGLLTEMRLMAGARESGRDDYQQ
jgi:Domain of unknown function (DUF4214)